MSSSRRQFGGKLNNEHLSLHVGLYTIPQGTYVEELTDFEL